VKLYWDARRRMEFLQMPEHWLLLLLLHFRLLFISRITVTSLLEQCQCAKPLQRPKR
jgi:hypothetical protein